METLVAFVDLQERVEDWPLAMVAGAAFSWMEGDGDAGGGGGVSVRAAGGGEYTGFLAQPEAVSRTPVSNSVIRLATEVDFFIDRASFKFLFYYRVLAKQGKATISQAAL